MSSPKRLHRESVLDCPPSLVWAKLQTPELFQAIIRPLLRYVPPQDVPFPARWEEGRAVRGTLYLFGFLRLGSHTIHIERVDHQRMEIQTREMGGLIRRWDHRMSVRLADDGRTIYSDEIEIDCGLLTPLVWLFAWWFYRHRHRRWRSIARQLAAG